MDTENMFAGRSQSIMLSWHRQFEYRSNAKSGCGGREIAPWRIKSMILISGFLQLTSSTRTHTRRNAQCAATGDLSNSHSDRETSEEMI
ncbi:hypothetical protein BH10CYA1_BH10CYA1_04170 [soil metagenome]